MRPFVALLLVVPSWGIVIQKTSTGVDVDEKSCAIRRPSTSFPVTERQVFFSLVARDVRAGDRLRMEWITPSNTIADLAAYDSLPDSPALCFITQLPVSGFAPAEQPGNWSVRIVVNEAELARHAFRIEPDTNPDRLRVTGVAITNAQAGASITLDGAGFDGGTAVHIATYSATGGWRYIHSVLPFAATSTRLRASFPALGPGEYLAIVRSSSGLVSRPTRFLVSTDVGYQLPFLPAERWRITQTPYGGFSHWRNTVHAYDLAPVSNGMVTAMRSGIAYTHDLGLGQTPRRRIFGNYITIDHGDGEFSHYAHLTTGTFQVRNGDRVEAGQPLARAGTSGYSFGVHLHVQVSRDRSVSSPSIPFRFAELAGLELAALRNREVVASPPAAVARSAEPVRPPPAAGGQAISAAVAVGGRWTDLVSVKPGTPRLTAALSWTGQDREFTLQIVSPSGSIYRMNGRQFEHERPEPGQWRLVVDGMRGNGEMMPFQIELKVAEPPSRGPSRRSGRGPKKT